MAMGRGNESFETHLIEEDGTLNGVKFDKFLKKVNLAACGLNYAVVSIMGPQSSGKSTLLNNLFGSNFEELDGLQRRGKTTKGIWMARCVGIEPCTLVMDVEGSDGRERGEDDTAFEGRSGLFALAVSHIVLINMFYTSVGLEYAHAASNPLLKNVLQGVLRLFSPRKTTLMFVVRDLVQTTQLDIFKLILMEDIQKIWDSIPKPEHHKTTPLSNFFNIQVEGLPNFMEKKEEFKKQVEILRQRFNNSIALGGLAGDRRDTTPGSGFSLSAQEIWKTIKEDRELDLPKNTVMIANRRCEEFVAEMLKAFDEDEERRKLEKDALTNPARDFREKYSSIIKSCMDGYDKKTEYYDEDVRSEMRKHLKEKLMLFVQSALLRIVAQIRSRTQEEFKEAYQNAMKKGKDATVTADNCKEACMKSFDDRCADVIVEQANCNTSEERKKLQLEIDNLVLQVQLEQEKKVMVANRRCGEIANKMFEDFVANKERRQLEEGAQTNIPATSFGKKYNSIINSYLHGYDKETEYYDGGFRSEKRKHLKEKMMQVVQSAFPPILANIGSKSLKEFEEAFRNALEKEKGAKNAAQSCKEACLKSFNDRCADVIVEQANCNTKEEREKLELAIDNDVLQVECILPKKKERKKRFAAAVVRSAMGVLSTAVVLSTGAAALGTLIGSGSVSSSSRGRDTSKVVEEKAVVGFKDEIETLMGKLHDREGGRLEIISIIGVGGGGKTTLAREVYDHLLTSQKFEIRAWANVSRDYNTTMKRDLLISILKSASPRKHEDYKESSEDKLGEKVYNCLKGRKYLIVMDDIWDIEAWNDIQRSFPREYKGSKVLSTSRLTVQQDNVPCIPHCLDPLPKSCSWELLQKKVFGKKQCPPELVNTGKQIAEKCEGLPLAIVAIAGTLATEDKTLYVWEKVAKNLSSIIAKNQEGCMEILELSYNHLPLYLKECFLYIGGHPRNFEIPVRDLIWLWIAEGFIQQSDEGKSLEAIAQDYLIDLIDRSLVMVARKSKSHGGIKACRIHDLLRELCLKKAEEDNFLVKNYRDDSFSPSATIEHRRLFVGRQLFRKLSPRPCVRNIQSFYLSLPNFLDSSLKQNLSFFVENFKLLRVLHLMSATIQGEIGIRDLVHLRYLALKLPHLHAPNCFQYLSNLETLNLQVSFRGDKISLPRDIVKMVKLRHLYTKDGIFEYHDVSNYDKAVGIMLRSLQTLHRMCMCEHCLHFLGRTPNLRKLGLCGRDISLDLEFLECLDMLYVECWQVRLKLPQTLTRLTLFGSFMKWEELSIILQTLPKLEVLKLLEDACDGPVWNTSELEVGFSQLKYLKFKDLNIKEWTASEDQFPRLEVLVIVSCKELKRIPIDFANQNELCEIDISYSRSSLEESAREIQEEQRNTKGDDACVNTTFHCNIVNDESDDDDE